MKKEITKKLLSLFILGLFIITLFAVPLVSANLRDSAENFWDSYIVPEAKYTELLGDVNSPTILNIVIIIGFIVFATIIFDIASFLPLNPITRNITAIGALIILVLLQIVRQIIGGLMFFIALGAGFGGAIGMIMVGVLFIIAAIALFTGAGWAHKYLANIRMRRETQGQIAKGAKAGGNIAGLKKMAEQSFS